MISCYQVTFSIPLLLCHLLGYTLLQFNFYLFLLLLFQFNLKIFI